MKPSVKTVVSILQTASVQGYIGEPVSQLEHALQAAYFASQDSPNHPSLIVAALLHDIGHLVVDAKTEFMAELGVLHHEETGALFLKNLGFNDEVSNLVKLHVAAKRYLVSKFDVYKERLSEASRKTLDYQGGFMSLEELHEFEQQAYFKDALKIRHFDDAAKKTDFKVPDLEFYLPLLNQVCS